MVDPTKNLYARKKSDFFQKDITKKIYEFYMDNLSPEDLENFNLEEEVKRAEQEAEKDAKVRFDILFD